METGRRGRAEAWGGPRSWLQTTVDTLPGPLSPRFLGAILVPASEQGPTWRLVLGPTGALEGRGDRTLSARTEGGDRVESGGSRLEAVRGHLLTLSPS